MARVEHLEPVPSGIHHAGSFRGCVIPATPARRQGKRPDHDEPDRHAHADFSEDAILKVGGTLRVPTTTRALRFDAAQVMTGAGREAERARGDAGEEPVPVEL